MRAVPELNRDILDPDIRLGQRVIDVGILDSQCVGVATYISLAVLVRPSPQGCRRVAVMQRAPNKE